MIFTCTLAPSRLLLYSLGFIVGIGFGALGIGIPLMAAAAFPDQRLRYTSLTNTFFAAGAVIGPFLGGLFLRLTASALPGFWVSGGMDLVQVSFFNNLAREMIGTALPVFWLSGGIVLLVFVLTLWGIDTTTTTTPTSDYSPSPITRSSPVADFAIYRSAALWACASVILVYAGLENGVGNWSPTFLGRSIDLQPDVAAWVVAIFYLMLTIGRIITTVIGTRFSAHRILLTAIIGSVLSAGLLLVGLGSYPLTIAATLLLGLCFGPVFPTMFALATTTFRASPGKAGSLVGAMGSLGGSILMPLQGMVLNRFGAQATTIYLMIIVILMFSAYGLSVVLLRNRALTGTLAVD
jgi:FHS family glucose/mannose:H+ symporter-like MFS transporter